MKHIVKDISFREYVELEDHSQYNYYLRYGKIEAEDVFMIGSFLEQTFGFVKDMQFYCSQGLTWEDFFSSISTVIDKTEKELSNISLFTLQKVRLYCIEEITKINEIESNFLGHTPTVEEEQADISRFSSYGAFIQFDQLAGGDILKFKRIEKLKYNFCFTKLKLEADRSNYQQDYNNIVKNKK